jgi:phosphatidylglycerophosphatase A
MKPHRVVGSFFGLGFLPWCPGTWGSVAGLLVVLVLPPVWSVVLMVFFFSIGTMSAKKWSREARDNDPQAIVIDEVVGMGVSLLFLPKNILFYAIAFLMFRFLDIKKPFGIRALESFGGGWGVMLDDLAAGIMANIVLQSAHLIYLMTKVGN